MIWKIEKMPLKFINIKKEIKKYFYFVKYAKLSALIIFLINFNSFKIAKNKFISVKTL